jgi:ABC-2 type transport system ATP-binding protein
VTPVVEVTHLVKRYRNAAVNAVDDVSFAVAEGELFALLGPNGAGKTTALSVLTTALVPTSGRVRIAGADPLIERERVRTTIGVVFQGSSLDLNLTAEENIRLHATLYGLYPWRPSYRLMPTAYRRQVDDLAGVLGVEGMLGRRARQLSGGTRRKLEIVRALMHRPRVLFLDEPTAGLDPGSRRNLWAYLRSARDCDATTVFLTTHYLEEAERADTVCVLADGRVIEYGSPATINKRHLGAELVVDSANRHQLRRELEALGLDVSGAAPFRVRLDGRSVQGILRAIPSELTLFQIVEPTLEDTYLRLVEHSQR